MKELNIILANAPINNGNRGCVALTITTLYLIDRLLKRNGIKYNIYLPDSQHVKEGKYEYVINSEDTIIYYASNYYRGSTFVRSIVIFFKLLLKGTYFKNRRIFVNSDYILDLGQGDSFSDIYGEYRFKFIDFIHKEARRLKKPYCMLPQTIGPFILGSKIEKSALKSLKYASLVMPRDYQSYQYVVDSQVIDVKDLYEFIDVAFYMPFKKYVFCDDYVHVGLNVSSLLWHGGYEKNNQFNLKVEYKDIVQEIIEYFISLPNVKLHLISHVVLQERDVENDYEICYELWEKYKNSNIVLAPFFLGPIEAKNYISSMNFFVGARMHSTIAAFSAGVPVVPMAYSRKFNGLYVDTLKYNYILDMKNKESKDILSLIKEYFENRDILESHICNISKKIVNDKEVLLDKVLSDFFMGHNGKK